MTDETPKQPMSDEEFESKVEEWHEGDSKLELHEYLGMTWEEYAAYVSPRRPTL